MKTVNEILNKAGEDFVNRLRLQFETLGLNDTHAAEQSISHKTKNQTLEIEGLLRVVVLISGRKPGKFPPIKPIRAWVISKLGVSEDDADRVAFLVARKIAIEGTNIFTRRAKGLQIEMLISEINEDLEEEVNTQIGLDITNTVFEAFK